MAISDYFSLLEAAHKRGGASEALAQLTDAFREQEMYHELFEALKMSMRHRLGLPLLHSESEGELDKAKQRALEEGLVEACREVGLLLLKSGKASEGWMYMQAVGDKRAACAALEQIEPDQEHLDDLISVMLHQGVDIERGYQLVLDHHGPCNAITTLDNMGRTLPPADRQIMAALLLRYIHHSLLDEIKSHIEKEEGTYPKGSSIPALLLNREWLLAEGGCHIDASHIASTVRNAIVLTDPDLLALALELTNYGRKLVDHLQYEGEEPFVDQYPASALFFEAQLNRHVDEAIAYFREKAETIDSYKKGTQSAETYIDLLTRLHRYEEATDALMTLLPPGSRTMGIAPTLLEIAQKSNSFARLKEISRQSEDLLGFSTALFEASAEIPSK